MAQNPWAVDSIKAFYFLKCPECDFDTKEDNLFENHATENHPLSFVLFDKKYLEEDFDNTMIASGPLCVWRFGHSSCMDSEVARFYDSEGARFFNSERASTLLRLF